MRSPPRPRRPPSWLRLASLALAGVLVLPAIAVAQEDLTPPLAGALQETDALQYSVDFGVSIPEAERRLSLQSELNALIGSIANTVPERYAGGWIEHTPAFRVVVRFTGGEAGLDRAEQLASEAPVPVALRSAAHHSLMELSTAQEKLPEAKTNQSGTSSYVDVKRGRVMVEYSGSDLAPDVGNLEALLEVPVRAEYVPVPLMAHHTYGGMQFSGCTTGFSVRHADGRTGVITNAHCSRDLTYVEFDGSSYSTTFQEEWYDDKRDLQWHTTPHVEYPEFLGISVLRTVSGQAYRFEQNVGDYVCHRGMKTGYSCGTIVSKTHKPTYGGACGGDTCANYFFKVEGPNLACWSGDSGGPWFNGTVAYGLHMAGSSYGTENGDCNYAVYMGISLIQGHPANLSLLRG